MILSEMIKKLLGFYIVGFTVTLLSLLMIFIFIGLLSTPLILSYILIYLTTIFVSYLLNMSFVFKLKKKVKRMGIYYLIYLSGMLIGVFLLFIFKKILPFENWIVTYFTIPITSGYNFLMLNYFLPR